MYLTRMKLDPAKRKTAIALVSPNLFHGAIEMSFEERTRKLWRIDNLNGNLYLLLLSRDKPDLTSAADQFGTDEGWRTLSYDKFLSEIKEGERRRFRLCANPVISSKKATAKGERGTVLAHVTTHWQKQWLIDRAEKNGFALLADDFTVVESKWISFSKKTNGGRPVTIHSVTFEGILTVTDKEKFCSALKDGIGRAKAYGMGLMTVMRKEA